jgi:hypothetical protein
LSWTLSGPGFQKGLILYQKQNKMAAHNTDNMGKLFVTVFAFAPAPKTYLQWFLHPDTRICS